MSFLAGRPPTASAFGLFGKKIEIGTVLVDGTYSDGHRTKVVNLTPGLFNRTPDCFLVCAVSTVAGTVQEVTISSPSASQFTIELARSNDTATSAMYAVISEEEPHQFRAGQIPTADELNGFEYVIQHGDIRLDGGSDQGSYYRFSGDITFDNPFEETPVVFANAISRVPEGDNGMIEVTASNVTTTGFTVYSARRNTTGHRVNWVAIGRRPGGAGFYKGLIPRGRRLEELGLNRKVAIGNIQMADNVSANGVRRFTQTVQLPRGVFKATPHIVTTTNSGVPWVQQRESTINDDTPSQFDIMTARTNTTAHRNYWLAVGD